MSGEKVQTRQDYAPVRVQSLNKSFGQQKVLNGVNWKLNAERRFQCSGRSGTGKSVLLKLIIGLQKPDSGSILLNKADVTKLQINELNEVRKKVGFLFQQAALYDSLTIQENVAFPLRRHSKMSDADRERRVNELLASVGMDKDGAKTAG